MARKDDGVSRNEEPYKGKISLVSDSKFSFKKPNVPMSEALSTSRKTTGRAILPQFIRPESLYKHVVKPLLENTTDSHTDRIKTISSP